MTVSATGWGARLDSVHNGRTDAEQAMTQDERSGQQQQQQERGLEQPGHQGLPQQDRQREGSDHSQTREPRPTWGEQTPERDRERAVGGGGSSSDSDGQQQ